MTVNPSERVHFLNTTLRAVLLPKMIDRTPPGRIMPETPEKFATAGMFLAVEPFPRLVFTWGDPDTPTDSMRSIT